MKGRNTTDSIDPTSSVTKQADIDDVAALDTDPAAASSFVGINLENYVTVTA